MSYLELNIIFVAVAALVLAGGLWRRARRVTALIAVLVAIGVLFVLTIVFDNVMIVSGLFDYGESSLSWARIGLMPVEDLAYPLAGAMLLPGLWLLLTPGRKE